MARYLVHALGASAGGGANYLEKLLVHLPRRAPADEWIITLDARHEVPSPALANLRLLRLRLRRRPGARLWADQVTLRDLIRRQRVDAILATGNFGMLRPPRPQVLLCRNALYFSDEHLERLLERGEYREWTRTRLGRRLALASMASSREWIVPTAAFAAQIRRYLPAGSSDRFRVIHHGYEPGPVTPCSRAAALPGPEERSAPRRLLLVSHYNYSRNFETLLRALALLVRRAAEPIELVLTTRLAEGLKEHRYDTSPAARLVEELGLVGHVRMIGAVPRQELGALYASADVVVCPSYAESFGHPMVEAMASGRPLVVSDRPVHREICGPAALYFDTFSPLDLAHQIHRLLAEPSFARQLGEEGRARRALFSWERHFDELLAALCRSLDDRAAWTREGAASA